MTPIQVLLLPSCFSPREEPFLIQGSLQANTFTYRSGVQGVRLSYGSCSAELLPFQGQQIWDAVFCGKRLTMKSIFDEPQPTDLFLMNYGGLMIHCGATAMGNPTPADTHPLHGELPNAAYQDAWLTAGTDQKGDFIALGGRFQYRVGLSSNYFAEPEVRLYAGATALEIRMKLCNLRHEPMDYMYLCHINFLPVDGSHLIYSAHPHAPDANVFQRNFASLGTAKQEALDAFTRLLKANPAIGDLVDSKSQVYDPEICSIYRYRSDEDGYAHAMQRMPDGDACYVSFRTAELPYGLRWIARTSDEDAMGFALPCTGNHLGRIYAQQNGLMKTLAPQESVEFSYRLGYLNRREAEKTEQLIGSILR